MTGTTNHNYWTDDKLKENLFYAMWALSLKRMPTKTELNSLGPYIYEKTPHCNRIITGKLMANTIIRTEGFIKIADRLRLDRLDNKGNLIKWRDQQNDSTRDS